MKSAASLGAALSFPGQLSVARRRPCGPYGEPGAAMADADGRAPEPDVESDSEKHGAVVERKRPI
jgi:hypothetical protein